MNLSDIKATPIPRQKKKRIGRGEGSGHGGTSTRGHKGYHSRSGSGEKRGYAGGQTPLFRRIPKRGFKNPCRTEYTVVNVSDLNCFPTGATVTVEELKQAGLVKKLRDGLKILGDGELKVALVVVANKFSKSASEKILGAGGQVKEI